MKLMKRWKICCGSLVMIAGLSPIAQAQIPPPPAPVPVAGATPVAAAPAAPAPANIWSKICMTPEQKAACKAKLCNSAIGQLLNNSLKPASALSGGIVPTLCPLVSPADLAKPADSAEGAAARIKADEIDAKARRESVRALGRFDCHYWPEAMDALIGALRADRNECVRLEAAWALNNGCCCTKATIKALVICVAGSEEDGNPSETSPRVKAAAQSALAHCLACYTEVVPAPVEAVVPEKKIETLPPPKGETPAPGAPVPPVPVPPLPVAPVPGASLPTQAPDKLPNTGQAPARPTDYYHRVNTLSRQQIMEEGQRVLNHVVPVAAVPVSEQPASPHSVTDLVRNAFTGTPEASSASPAPMTVEKMTPKPVIIPASSPPPPLAPVSSKWTPMPEQTDPQEEVKPSVHALVSKTPSTTQSTLSQAPSLSTASMVSTAMPTAAPRKPVQQPSPYQTQTFIPNASASEKASIAPVSLKVTENKSNLPPAAVPPITAPSLSSKAQMIALLQNSPKAEQRLWAAQTLSGCDGWTNPDIVQALIKGARTDTDPLVRVACIHCLGRMNVCTLGVLTTVQELKSDRDPQVRAEVELALRQLGEASTLHTR